jgi:hypothetical protein
VRIANASTRLKRTIEHRQRLARCAGREDRDSPTRRRDAMFGLGERRVVDPAEDNARDRIPERE